MSTDTHSATQITKQTPRHGSPPRVSVIIPAYNCADYIAETLDSVLSQTYRPLEIIVVDDGSTDATASIVRSFDAPVQYIAQAGSGRGAGASRNTGIQQSCGDYIAFLDGDDVWLPGKLTAQIQYLTEHPEVHMSATQFALWHPDDQGRWPAPRNMVDSYPSLPCTAIDPDLSGWLYHKLLLDTVVWTGTVVMRRTLINQVGLFREDLKLGQDYDYWLRASRYTPIDTLEQIYALYRRHPRSATVKWAPLNYEYIALQSAIDRWGLTGPDGQSISRRQLRRRLGGLHFTMGYRQYWAGNRADALPAFSDALKNRPLFWRTWVYVLLCSLARLQTYITNKIN